MSAVTLAAMGASAVMALIILSQSGQSAFREEWESKHGKLESLARLPASGQVVPFRLVKENPILPILLDGDTELTCWIVDSGYGYTAVDTKLAERLKLKPNGKMAVQTLQTDSLDSTMLPSGYVFNLSTGQPVVEIPRHSAVVRPLSGTLSKTYGGGFGNCTKQGGILGITFLRHFVTRLDYKNRTFTFYDPSRFHYPMEHGRGMKFTGFLSNEHYFLIPMDIDGVRANMALDTGAFATILTKGFLNKYRRARGKEFDAKGVKGTVEASFSESLIDLNEKIVDNVTIGDDVIKNLEVLFPDCAKAAEECPGLLATKRFDGLLGYSVLKNYVIYMVYEPTPYVIFERSQ